MKFLSFIPEIHVSCLPKLFSNMSQEKIKFLNLKKIKTISFPCPYNSSLDQNKSIKSVE